MYAKNAPVTEVKGLFSKLIKFIAPFMIRQDLRFVNRMYNLYNYTSRASNKNGKFFISSLTNGKGADL